MKCVINCQRFLFIVLLILLWKLPAIAQTQSMPQDVLGWQETKWGMSEGEIFKAFRSSLKPLPKNKAPQGNFMEHCIPDYMIEGINFTVLFKMDDRTKGLNEVMISHAEMPSLPNNIGFDRIASLLARKYGQPSQEKNQKEGGIEKRSAEWIFPTTTITLSHSFFKVPQLMMLTIKYIPTKGGDVNKL